MSFDAALVGFAAGWLDWRQAAEQANDYPQSFPEIQWTWLDSFRIVAKRSYWSNFWNSTSAKISKTNDDIQLNLQNIK